MSVMNKMNHYGVRGSVRAWQAWVVRFDAGWRARVAWWGLLLGAMAMGLFALRYALPKPPFLLNWMPNYVLHPRALSTHAITAAIALLIGPWQLSASLRSARPRLHRWLGRIYAADVLAACLVALPIAPWAAAGFASASAFFVFGVLWMGFTVLGVLAIRGGDVRAHRRWMLRSFALAWSPVTIHLYALVANIGIGMARLYFVVPEIPIEHSYPVGLWLTLLTNLLVVELALRRFGTRAAKIESTNTAWKPVLMPAEGAH
jgi:uncharacterized membrane protein